MVSRTPTGGRSRSVEDRDGKSAPTRRCQRQKGHAQLHYREERLERFRRCCRFRSFHLAFWLLLSFARDALVHLNAIGRSVAAVSERPDPPM